MRTIVAGARWLHARILSVGLSRPQLLMAFNPRTGCERSCWEMILFSGISHRGRVFTGKRANGIIGGFRMIRRVLTVTASSPSNWSSAIGREAERSMRGRYVSCVWSNGHGLVARRRKGRHRN